MLVPAGAYRIYTCACGEGWAPIGAGAPEVSRRHVEGNASGKKAEFRSVLVLPMDTAVEASPAPNTKYPIPQPTGLCLPSGLCGRKRCFDFHLHLRIRSPNKSLIHHH